MNSQPSTPGTPGDDAPAISVVVITYDRADLLRRLLAALKAQTLTPERFELVIVDNASPDRTAELIATEIDRGELNLRALRQAVNRGRAAARDRGWRETRAPLVAFTDDDCVPSPDWLARLLEAARRNPGAIIQGRTDPDPEQLHRLGPFARTIRVNELDAAFQTCNVAYPRALLERVDGFDAESFGVAHGGEDADLGWRAIKEAGAGAVYVDEVRVHHAVNELGPIGNLRLASSWCLRAYARHPELRRAHFSDRVFWRDAHRRLFLALGGALLAARGRRLGLLLALPYLRSLQARSLAHRRGVALAAYYVLVDCTEVGAAARESVRNGTVML